MVETLTTAYGSSFYCPATSSTHEMSEFGRYAIILKSNDRAKKLKKNKTETKFCTHNSCVIFFFASSLVAFQFIFFGDSFTFRSTFMTRLVHIFTMNYLFFRQLVDRLTTKCITFFLRTCHWLQWQSVYFPRKSWLQIMNHVVQAIEKEGDRWDYGLVVWDKGCEHALIYQFYYGHWTYNKKQ